MGIKILATNINTVVYFVGTNAPRIGTTTITYDYSGCDGYGNGNDDILPIVQQVATNNYARIIDDPADWIDPNDDCVQTIYTTTYRDACFVSKDPNYDPYLYLNN